MIELAIVVPCFNEEDVLRETTSRLLSVLRHLSDSNRIAESSRIYYVDDGSKDATWDLIVELGRSHPQVCGIKLAQNRGHQNALLAGLYTVPGDALVSIDADLQDDVTAIDRMVDEHLRGAQIVYGVRDDRSTDSAFKRGTAQAFYRLMSLLGVEVLYNHADFRLMSRAAVEALKQFREVNLFLRGIVPLIGFRSSIVTYKRSERFAGESKYPLRRMISFALEGITSFSVTPLRIVTALGITIFAFSMLMSLFVVAARLFTDRVVPGWASTVLPVYLLGGIQIFCIGIIGEYIGKIYKEVKDRPRYIIEECNNFN